MATIVYLDVDDEITSAAARIRGAPEIKVALVLPPGSRLSTSRINFRLLAREALERNRVLSIVAADPAARAIAASAGLPVHPTVADFEATLGPIAADLATPAVEPIEPPPKRSRRRSGSAGGVPAPSAEPTPDGPGVILASEQLSADLVPPSDALRPRDVVPSAPRSEPRPAPAARPFEVPRSASESPLERSVATVPPPTETRARSGAAAIPVISAGRSRPGLSGGLIATLGAIGVVVLILAVVAYLVLPSATVVVTPVAVPVGPVQFVVRADPDATGIDATAGVVPAQRLTRELAASGNFAATGKRVAQTKAKGSVTFRNCDTSSSHTVPAGSVVSTGTGIGFATTQSVRIAQAPISPAPCTKAAVGVVAVKQGTGGNVGAGDINQVPPGFNESIIFVTNPAPTSGGSRQDFVRVQQSDIDTALAGLTKQLGSAFDTWAAAPADLPAGTTVFPATGKLGDVLPSVDPTSLLNTEVTSFTLGANATGTVVAVDPKVVDQVAAERIKGQVPTGHTLQAGSAKATHDSGQANGEVVDFRVSATAAAIPDLDPNALREQIKGKSVAEARRLLEQYGTVTIDTWPGFVDSIPSLDARLDLRIVGVVGNPTASPTPAGSTP